MNGLNCKLEIDIFPLFENKLAEIILDTSFEIHRVMGPGLFESVYEEILTYELRNKELFVSRQQPIPVFWKGQRMERGFCADLIVENTVIVEIKSIEQFAPVHYKQVLTYLKLTKIKLGLLLNFNQELLKNGIRRVVNNL